MDGTDELSYLKQKLDFEKKINEVEIKRRILLHIIRNDNPIAVKALQDLFLDIYVYPEDVFDNCGASRLLGKIDKLNDISKGG